MAALENIVHLQKGVQHTIDSSHGEVISTVVDRLVREEINRRADLIAKGLTELRKREIEVKKIKPDVVNYNPNGEVAVSQFSKARYEELKKAQEFYTRLETALGKAIEVGEFKTLEEALK